MILFTYKEEKESQSTQQLPTITISVGPHHMQEQLTGSVADTLNPFARHIQPGNAQSSEKDSECCTFRTRYALSSKSFMIRGRSRSVQFRADSRPVRPASMMTTLCRTSSSGKHASSSNAASSRGTSAGTRIAAIPSTASLPAWATCSVR